MLYVLFVCLLFATISEVLPKGLSKGGGLIRGAKHVLAKLGDYLRGVYVGGFIGGETRHPFLCIHIIYCVRRKPSFM